MLLVLCSKHDRSGLWAYEGLKLRSTDSVELVTPEMLVCSLRCDHRIGADGSSVAVALPDGRTLSSKQVTGTLNRVLQVPDIFAGSPDRDYAMQELTALMMSLLYCLPGPVLNPPTPQGLSGRWRHPSEWALLAHDCGLATRPYRESSRIPNTGEYWQARQWSDRVQSVIVLAEHVFPRSLPRQLMDSCRMLAERAETPLLGIDFVLGADGVWAFAGASPCPDLINGGDEFLDALAVELGGVRKEVAA